MEKCGDCNFYCKERRICVRDEKFYFESYPSCEEYKKDIDINKLGMMGIVSDVESFK